MCGGGGFASAPAGLAIIVRGLKSGQSEGPFPLSLVGPSFGGALSDP